MSPDISPLLRGDAHRLRQVLTNLSANAVKFTERGEVALNVEPVSEEDGKATVRFTIADTGIGIRADQAAALFSPFTQADDSTTRKYGGTGLGLAISKQLVEMMGGTIGLDSRPGQGSTFWFTAVFEKATEEAVALAEEPVSTTLQNAASERIGGVFINPSGVTGATRETRILVAEDNATNRAVALAQLEKLGYRADAFPNGAETVAALQVGSYDLILMDCEMPVMDGYAATRLIRESSNPHIPIIALTASAMSGDRDRCIREGMDGYLSKPVDLKQLAEVVAKWCPKDSRGVLRPAGQAARKPASAVFDAEAFLKRLMGDRQLAATILKGFVGNTPSQLDHLRKRIDEADAPGARLQAHALKGAAATVSARNLRAIAEEMESDAGAGELDRCSELLPRAVEEFDRLNQLLEHNGWVGTEE